MLNMKHHEFRIRGEFIELQQLLKVLDFISIGGEIRSFLEEVPITVNGEPEDRRRRKIRAGDVVQIADSDRITIL